MENILHDFNEKVISLVGNCLKNAITEKGISDFTNDLESEMIAFGRDVVQFLVEYAENIIFKLKDRKEKFESLEKDNRTIISIFGYKCQYINEQKIKNKNVQKRKLCNLSRFIFYFFYFVFYSIGSTCNINNMRVMQ